MPNFFLCSEFFRSLEFNTFNGWKIFSDSPVRRVIILRKRTFMNCSIVCRCKSINWTWTNKLTKSALAYSLSIISNELWNLLDHMSRFVFLVCLFLSSLFLPNASPFLSIFLAFARYILRTVCFSPLLMRQGIDFSIKVHRYP